MLIIGIGGTTRPGSSSEVALRTALDGARACGADVRLFGASDLQLPLYDPTAPTRTDEAVALIDAITRADGVVISSPGYHGTVSGLVKNALDYVEDSAADVDMNVVRTDAGRYVEVQGTGEDATFTREELDGLLELADVGIDALLARQEEVLGDLLPKIVRQS